MTRPLKFFSFKIHDLMRTMMLPAMNLWDNVFDVFNFQKSKGQIN